MKIALLLFAAAAFALGGCGHKGPLSPPTEDNGAGAAQNITPQVQQ